MDFFNRKAAKWPAALPRRAPGAGPVAEALKDVSHWIDELRECAAQTAQQVDMEAKARAAGAEGDGHDEMASSLMAALAERTGELRGDADELARLLDRATLQIQKAGVREDVAETSTRPTDEQVKAAKAKLEAAEAAREDASMGLPGHVSEGVRLLTMQMAVAGSSREEIKVRLLKEFKVQNPDQVLDEVLNAS